jgi:Na+/H+ antiporter NhaD/arsenite permease-like protein
LIASAAKFTFNDVLVHLAPIAVVAVVVTQPLLLFLFRRDLRGTVKAREAVATLDARAALVRPKEVRRLLVVFAGTVLLYLLHGELGIGPGLVALIGASAALLWVRPPIEELVKSVEWDVLLFFVGLFVIVGGMRAAGVLEFLANGISALTTHGILLTAIVLLWASAVLSSLLGSIPITMVMIPILLTITAQRVDAGPLWWALAIGAGFGGNGTPIGSAAGVLIVSISERAGAPISVREWLRTGVPATLASCVIGSAGLALAVWLGLF